MSVLDSGRSRFEGPRVALVNPPNTRANIRENANSVPPLGLAYIASFLRRHGFSADLFDFADELSPTPEFVDLTGVAGYDVVGFTSYTKTFPAALELAGIVRELNPAATIVFGGPHVTPSADQVMRDNSTIDFIVRNDGEAPMLDLCRYLRTGAPALPSIAGLSFRASTCPNDIIHTPDHDGQADLDALPWPARDWKLRPRLVDDGTAYLSSSRGCPKRCTFCSIIVMNPKYRRRSVASMMGEITALHVEQPFHHIAFHDANFFVDAKRTLAFARALHGWNPSVTWSGTATADSVAKHEVILEEIGRLNCSKLEVGIESGSDSVLSRYNKGTTTAHNRAAIALMEASGIELDLDFIMFDPEVTLAELRENITFLRESDLSGRFPSEHFFNALKLYPGTPARDRYLDFYGDRMTDADTLIPPFLHEETETAFSIIIAYGERIQKRVDGVIVQLDTRMRELLEGAEASCTRRDAIKARSMARCMLALRHFPGRFVEWVVEAIAHGDIAKDARFHNLSQTPLLTELHALLQSAEGLLGQGAAIVHPLAPSPFRQDNP